LTSIHASRAESDSIEEARKALLSDTPGPYKDARRHPFESLADGQQVFFRLLDSIGEALLNYSHLPLLTKCRVPMGIGASLLILSGCANEETFGLASQWREGVAISIVQEGAIPDGTSMQCISSPPRSAALPRDALVAIVRMHIGRAPFDEAFEIPQGVAVRTGDVIRVQPRTCLLRDTSKTGS
jgi:hypothetical protein